MSSNGVFHTHAKGAHAPASPAAPFVHLDVQSCYSLFCSPATPEDYAGAAAAHYRQSPPNVRAIALADYGLHSAVKMAVACRQHGLQHIPGLRVRVVPERAYRPWNEQPGELILLAMDEVGWLNLVALNNLGHVVGWGGGPRVDWRDLAAHADGLICLTGPPAAGMLAPLFQRAPDAETHSAALVAARRLAAIYPGRLYLEVAYLGHTTDKLANLGLLALAERLDLPVVATNAVRFATREQALAQYFVQAIGTGRRAAGVTSASSHAGARFGRAGGDVPAITVESLRSRTYLKSPREMWSLFGGTPEALLATEEIARWCQFRLPLADETPPDRRYGATYFFPSALTRRDRATAALRRVAAAGLAARYLAEVRGQPPPAAEERLREELATICAYGLQELLLAAREVARFCADRTIPLRARGSTTSSLVAWALRLVELCPLDHDLPASTFLYRGRPDVPDLDLEVAASYETVVRNALLHPGSPLPPARLADDGYALAGDLPHVRALRVGMKVAVGARNAVRQVGQVLGVGGIAMNALARHVPSLATKGAVEEVLTRAPDLGVPGISTSVEPYHTILEIAAAIEALPQRFGPHPAGLVVAPQPVDGGRRTADGREPAATPDGEDLAVPGLLHWLPAQWTGAETAARGAAIQPAAGAAGTGDGPIPSLNTLAHPGALGASGDSTVDAGDEAAGPHDPEPSAAEPAGDGDASAGAAGGDTADAGSFSWPASSGAQPALACQWDKDDLAALGVGKIDVSASAGLACGAAVPPPKDARAAAQQRDLALRLFAAAETLCVSFLESWGFRKLLQRASEAHTATGARGYAVETLEDLAQLLALRRPGAYSAEQEADYLAVKYGQQAPEYPHPALAAVLGATHGQVLYAEQLTDLVKLLGVDHAQAERFRRALDGGDFAVRERLEQSVRASAETQGWNGKQVDGVLALVRRRQGYLFNHGHALAYAATAFREATLKADPQTAPAFFAAVLDNGGSTHFGLGTAVEEARRCGVRLLPPCVNRSAGRYVVERLPAGETGVGTADETHSPGQKGTRRAPDFGPRTSDFGPGFAIRAPLAAIRGLSPGVAEHVLAVRAAFGPFSGLLDFSAKVDRRIVTRHDLLLLIKVGAFAFTHVSRSGLTLAEQVYTAGADLARSDDANPQGMAHLEEDLVAGAARYLNVEEWPPEVLAAIDMAHLGYYAGVPLVAAQQAVRLAAELGGVHIAALIDYPDRAPVAVGALITTCRVRQTRKGELMAWLTLADATGAIECAVFPVAYARLAGSGVLRQGAFIAAIGRLSQQESSGPKLFVDEVRPLGSKATRWSALAVAVEPGRGRAAY